MNERIKLLRKYALNFCYDNGGEPENLNKEFCEKFAELIVLECAGLVQGVPTDSMGYHTADQKIKEHFGVQ